MYPSGDGGPQIRLLEERAKELQQLIDCRKIADPTQRLACFDQAASSLDQAEAKGDIVVVNREQARKVRRQAFGFTMPSISLFERGEKPEDISSTEGKCRRPIKVSPVRIRARFLRCLDRAAAVRGQTSAMHWRS